MSDELVLIGYDGSEIADHAVREAARALGPRPALIAVVWEAGVAYQTFESSAFPVAPVDLQAAAQVDEALYEGARHTAAHGVEVANEAGFRAEGVAVADAHSVAETLAELARERGAAVIVVGARGHSGFQKLLLGSTSKKLLEDASCPVLVVPAVKKKD